MDHLFGEFGKNAAGVKDSSGERELLQMFLRWGRNIEVCLVGDERLLSESLSHGGAGPSVGWPTASHGWFAVFTGGPGPCRST